MDIFDFYNGEPSLQGGSTGPGWKAIGFYFRILITVLVPNCKTCVLLFFFYKNQEIV